MKSIKFAAVALLIASATGCAGFQGVSVAEANPDCQYVTSRTSSGVADKANAGYNSCYKDVTGFDKYGSREVYMKRR